MKSSKIFVCVALFLCFFLTVAVAMGAESTVHLDLSDTSLRDTEAVLEELAGHPGIQSVTFGPKALSAQTLDAIWAVYPGLELEYGFAIGNKTIRSTATEANVTTEIKKVDQLIENLKYLPNLREFKNFQTSYTYHQLETISQLYPDLHMSCTLYFQGHRVRTDVTAYSTLHSSKSDRHTQEDFFILKYIDHLLALDLGHNAITDISFLRHFPDLKILILADNQIEDIEPIRPLKDLEYLELFRNPIQNLEPLSGLINLLDLNASYCNITDATPLLGLTKLQRLWISQNTWFLSDDQQEQLRQALPNCRFNFTVTTGSSAGGWRDQYTHYTTVTEIFASRRYKEFKK